MTRKLFMILASVYCVMSTHAASFEVNGIYYESIDDSTAIVVPGSEKYTGSVVIPDVVTYSGTQYKVTAIGESTFAYCDNMQAIIIGNNVSVIGEKAFLGCDKLTAVDFPQSLTSIGGYAFSFCHGLEAIDIPNSVTSLGECCFAQCTNASSLKIGSGVTTIPLNAFHLCTNLTSVVIPENVSVISNYAFMDCNRLSSVVIRSVAISIDGARVFDSCSALDSLIFDESVRTIRSSSFCLGNQTNVISLAKYPPVCEGDTSPFAGVSPYCVLYVPKGRTADYRVAKGWAGQFRAVDEIADPGHSANCDVNGDGVVDIADVTLVIKSALAK